MAPGLPVAVGEIERQLGLLWEQSEAGKVRASLINLVIYSEEPGALERNTALLASIAANHAFRALVVQGNPQAEKSDVRAWITAHCHRRDAGQKEICSEQITFQLDGPAASMLPNIVFAHLDSDLPLYLWWQGELPTEPEPQLWRWVERLIVDSVAWQQPSAQFRALREIEKLGRGRCAVSDLTWTRFFHLRYAVAAVFDLPAVRESSYGLGHLTITHAPDQRITALEFLGWMASRLEWSLEDDGQAFFRRPGGGRVDFQFEEESATRDCLTSVVLDFGEAVATVQRAAEGDFYLLDAETSGAPVSSQMLPAGREGTSGLLLSELSRGSRHPLFWPAVRAVEPLIAALT